MPSNSMYKISVEGQEDILVPSKELADTMSALFENAVVTEIGRKDALASVRLATKVEKVPSVWLGLLEQVQEIVKDSDTFAQWKDLAGIKHDAIALCAVLDAYTGDVTMTVRNVSGRAAEGKVYAEVDGAQWGSLAEFIHANKGSVTGLYAAQAASQYNRVDGKPTTLKQVKV